jgi:7-cyano-7-deazaguanine synthase
VSFSSIGANLGYFRSVKPSKTSFFACHFACLFVPLPPKTNALKRKMKDTILILSGGMDSTTMLYEYKDRIAMAISFDYGANHNRREIKCASLHCERLGITHAVIPLDFMRRYFRSSLLDGAEAIPEGHYDDENMHSSVVPFRNGIMLAVAVGMAESNDLKNVMMANHGGDHTIYPDCRPEFVEAFDRAAEAGTFNGVRLLSPYCHMTKADIARRGKELCIDYSETWSCYKGEDVHCGRCGTCVERREALAEAGIEDTTEYAE